MLQTQDIVDRVKFPQHFTVHGKAEVRFCVRCTEFLLLSVSICQIVLPALNIRPVSSLTYVTGRSTSFCFPVVLCSARPSLHITCSSKLSVCSDGSPPQSAADKCVESAAVMTRSLHDSCDSLL